MWAENDGRSPSTVFRFARYSRTFFSPVHCCPWSHPLGRNFRSLFMPRSGQFSKEQWGSSLKENWALHQGVSATLTGKHPFRRVHNPFIQGLRH